MQSDAYATLLSRTLQRSVLDALLRRRPTTPAQQTLSTACSPSSGPSSRERIEPQLSVYLEKLIKQSIRRTEKRLVVALDVEAVRGLIDEVWDGVAPMKLSEAFAFLSSHDLEDFVVLGYEFWQRYRKTQLLPRASRASWSTTSSPSTATKACSACSTTSASPPPMVSAELHGFLAPLVERARKTGLLEQRIRAHLEALLSLACRERDPRRRLRGHLGASTRRSPFSQS